MESCHANIFIRAKTCVLATELVLSKSICTESQLVFATLVCQTGKVLYSSQTKVEKKVSRADKTAGVLVLVK